jgi:Ca2+-transporting ATPase
MDRKPRKADEEILDAWRFAWIAIAGLIMAIGTVGIGWYLDDRYGADVSRTGALTVFSIFNLVFSFTALDEKRTMFSLEGFSDRKFLLATGMSIAAIVMGTELNVFNRFLQTTGLTRAQWGACLVIPLSLVAASEAWKWYLRRRAPEQPASLASEPVEAPA